MFNTTSKYALLGIFFISFVLQAKGQQKVLSLKEAEQIALANYGTIKAKANQLNASKSSLKETHTEALPDLNVSAQQAYGTVNGTTGPLFGYHGLAVSSSGPTLPNQNYNAAFGSLYVSNINWDFFAFGKAREKVKVQGAIVSLDETDLVQEQFQHEIRVASTYLNLLVAQQLSKAQQDNLDRSMQLQTVVIARVKNGLNPGVDSALANAEVSNAKIALTNAQQIVQEQNNQLAQYLGVNPQDFQLDSTFVTKAPPKPNALSTVNFDDHPELRFYRNRIGVSDEQAKYLSTFSYPTFSLFGVYQGRGSGFKSDYGVNNLSDYSTSFGAGADPTRYNYLLGVAVIWNITNPFRVHYQVQSQKYTSDQLRNEYELVGQQLKDQQLLAEIRINNALKNYNEAPVEVKAATDAYNQKFALYKNGLANIVDFTQALFVLNRAEVDRDIVSNNVWQAVLSKAAATGDFGIFMNNF
jgi:outer membrane protein TolC